MMSSPATSQYIVAVDNTGVVISAEYLAAVSAPPTRVCGGVKYWENAKGQLHRDFDLPANVWSDGSELWYVVACALSQERKCRLTPCRYRNGKLHRDGDKPAYIDASGYKKWSRNGKNHRDGGKPAIEYPSGRVEYWIDGDRQSGPPATPPAVVATATETPAAVPAAPATVATAPVQSGPEGRAQSGVASGSPLALVITTDRRRGVPQRHVEYVLDGVPLTNVTKLDIDASGTKQWKNSNGEWHRDGDLPAIEWANGQQEWYVNGKRHRDGDEPAYVDNSGLKMWFRDGKQHRDGDKPAEECSGGTKKWYFNGVLHRADDKPAVECAGGRKDWYVYGKRHRDGGQPAHVSPAGDAKCWYVDDKLHRVGGPARIDADGEHHWYTDGVKQFSIWRCVLSDGTIEWRPSRSSPALHNVDDEPARIKPDGTKEWYRNGKRHRDGDKPAIEYADGTRAWYRDGVQQRQTDSAAPTSIVSTTTATAVTATEPTTTSTSTAAAAAPVPTKPTLRGLIADAQKSAFDEHWEKFIAELRKVAGNPQATTFTQHFAPAIVTQIVERLRAEYDASGVTIATSTTTTLIGPLLGVTVSW